MTAMDWTETLRSLRAHLGNFNAEKERTLHFILQLTDRIPNPFSAKEVLGLEKLARKVDIAKKLYAAYDDPWTRPADKTSMALEAWPLLIAIFLYQADCSSQKEKALRWINSAFNAIDIYRKGGGIKHVELLAGTGEHFLNSIIP